MTMATAVPVAGTDSAPAVLMVVMVDHALAGICVHPACTRQALGMAMTCLRDDCAVWWCNVVHANLREYVRERRDGGL